MDSRPSGNDCPQGDVADANATTLTPMDTSTPRATSRAAISCASSRLPLLVDIKDEDMFNKEEEMPIEHDQPPWPYKKRSWSWEHFTKIPSDIANPLARCHHCAQLCGCHSNKQGTSVLIAHLNGCQRYKIAKGLAATDQTNFSYATSTATDGT